MVSERTLIGRSYPCIYREESVVGLVDKSEGELAGSTRFVPLKLPIETSDNSGWTDIGPCSASFASLPIYDPHCQSGPTIGHPRNVRRPSTEGFALVGVCEVHS